MHSSSVVHRLIGRDLQLVAPPMLPIEDASGYQYSKVVGLHALVDLGT